MVEKVKMEQYDNGTSENIPMSYDAKIALNILASVRLKVELNRIEKLDPIDRNPFRERLIFDEIESLLTLNRWLFILAE